MEVYFNEIAARYGAGSHQNARLRMSELLEICKSLKDRGFNLCRIPEDKNSIMLGYDYTLTSWISDTSIYRTEKSFALKFLRPPFEPEDDVLAEQYISTDFILDEPEETQYNGIVTKGLALSCLLDTLCVGFASGRVWEKPFINLLRMENTSGSQAVARHLSKTENLSYHEDWIESLSRIELVESDLNPEDKTIRLSDDHGKDKLMVIARKLVRHRYVKSVSCSLPFDTSGRSFIRKVYPDGRIAITLLRYDAGYSLMVETTGRNFRETKNIAEILKEKYES